MIISRHLLTIVSAAFLRPYLVTPFPASGMHVLLLPRIVPASSQNRDAMLLPCSVKGSVGCCDSSFSNGLDPLPRSVNPGSDRRNTLVIVSARRRFRAAMLSPRVLRNAQPHSEGRRGRRKKGETRIASRGTRRIICRILASIHRDSVPSPLISIRL